MKSETSYFLIGLFVIVGIILLTAGVIALGAREPEENDLKAYTLLEDSVSGLEVGAKVRFRGVDVGEVETMGLAAQFFNTQEEYILVNFRIRPVTQDRSREDRLKIVTDLIAQGMRIRVASSGLTGSSYLEADIDKTDPAPPLTRDWIGKGAKEERLYFPSEPSTLTSIVNSVEKVLKNLGETDVKGLVKEAEDTIASIRKVVDDLDINRLEENVNGLIDDARAALKDLDTKGSVALDEATVAIKSIDEAAKSVTALLEDPKIQSFLTEINTLVADADTVIKDPNLKKALANVEGATRAATETFAAIKDAVAPVPRLVADARRLIQGKGREVDSILRNLDQITAHINSLTATIDRYPSYLLFGNPPPEKGNDKK